MTDSFRQAQEEESTLGEIEAALRWGRPADAATLGITNGLWQQVPSVLYRLWSSSLLDDDALCLALPEVWIVNKAPLLCLGQRAWVRMFKATGFLSRVETRSGHPSPFPVDWAERPPDGSMLVWRGALVSTGGRGLSWSPYQECARDFAQTRADLDGPAALYRALVPSGAVLAVFGDWREQEVVINPDFLRGRIDLVTEVARSQVAEERREMLRKIFGGS